MGAILAEVQKLLQASLTQYSMPLPAAAVQLIQPVIAQLMTSCLLQAKTGATSVLNQAHLHQADHQLLAQAIALAAEFQQMLGRKSMELRVALVAHDLKSTGEFLKADTM